MALARDFQELRIWQRSHRLAIEIYKLTNVFPKSEQFGLTNQMRRAAVSVPSNIAEGFERNSAKDFSHFLVIARGSLAELKAQLLLAQELHYAESSDVDKILFETDEIHKMLNAFRTTLIKKGLAH